MTHTILIVDDAPDWRNMLAGLIGDVFSEIEIITASSMDEAKSCLDQHNFKLAIIDLRLDDSDEENVDGLELAEFIHTHYEQTQVLILTGYPSIETVKRAMQPDETGIRLAVDYIVKDNMNEELLTRISTILEENL
jgi:DNA-binding NtrC family response regulator